MNAILVFDSSSLKESQCCDNDVCDNSDGKVSLFYKYKPTSAKNYIISCKFF